jgi:predicted ATPase
VAAAGRQLERHAAGIIREGPQAPGAARRDGRDLCEQPLPAPDYLRIDHEFHTLIIDRIPVMGFEERNAAKRFIILIDTLYDHAVKLVASAAAEPDALYDPSSTLANVSMSCDPPPRSGWRDQLIALPT